MMKQYCNESCKTNSMEGFSSTGSDRISEPPDDILSFILSHLTLRDAVKTSILSHRWGKVSASRSKLHFNWSNMFLYNENDISFDENGIFYGFKKDPSREEKDKFVKAVNQFLKFHAGTRIVSFVVSFHLGNDYKNDVDEWIRSAIDMGAERLTLCLSVQDGEQIDKYVFCCELLSQGTECNCAS